MDAPVATTNKGVAHVGRRSPACPRAPAARPMHTAVKMGKARAIRTSDTCSQADSRLHRVGSPGRSAFGWNGGGVDRGRASMPFAWTSVVRHRYLGASYPTGAAKWCDTSGAAYVAPTTMAGAARRSGT